MDWQAILDAIYSAVNDAVSFVIDIINSLIDVLNALFQVIATLFSKIFQFLKDFPSNLKDFLDDVWNEIIVPGWEKIQQIYDDIQTWLENVLDPIIQVLQTIRKWFYDYIYPWIKRVQDILSIARAMLAALRILGVKWAAKLDAELAKIQGYITSVLQDIVGTLNAATTWLQFAIDPLGIIRKDVYSATLFTGLASLTRAVNFGRNRYLTASEAQNTQDDRNMLGGGAAILTPNKDGTVTYSAASQRINSGYTDAWNSYGNPKL